MKITHEKNNEDGFTPVAPGWVVRRLSDGHSLPLVGWLCQLNDDGTPYAYPDPAVWSLKAGGMLGRAANELGTDSFEIVPRP